MSRGRLPNRPQKGKTMYNESRKKSTIKYIKERRDRISINIPKGKKEEYKAHAAKRGKSLSRLIMDLLEDDMEISGKE